MNKSLNKSINTTYNLNFLKLTELLLKNKISWTFEKDIALFQETNPTVQQIFIKVLSLHKMLLYNYVIHR